ncbi:zonadhesin-like isoform X3 [Patiria miniata]|uniref:Kielin/chordin-like protein n=1 Tax=Patiria miniata TaxID=46514 RepID=A0A914AYI5_PATMI|nr:zonadhesin-like isoform X3 [Patiria miniata]
MGDFILPQFLRDFNVVSKGAKRSPQQKSASIMTSLVIATLLCLVALASGQLQECTDNPCGEHSTACYLKPDGVTPYCYCTPNYEGDTCAKFNRQRYSCSSPAERNFYGQKSGSLTSPNYPANYPISQACPYFIGSPDAKKFELTVHDLSFEKGKDELTIGTGSLYDANGYEYLFDQEKYDTMPGPLTLEGDRTWFNFYSDFNNPFKGFNISYRVDGDECLSNPCGMGQTCVDGEYTYTCEGQETTDNGNGASPPEIVSTGGGETTEGGPKETTIADRWRPAIIAVDFINQLSNKTNGGGGGRECTIEGQTYADGFEWDMTPCSFCNCKDGTGSCEFKQCPYVRCKIPAIRDNNECCHTCPPKRLFVNQVSFSFGGSSGSIISHKSNAMVINVDVGRDMERSSAEFSGSNLWKVGMYTKMKAEAGGGQISANEQILDKRKANKKLLQGDKLKFHKLKYNLDLTDRRCEDIEEVCATFDKGDKANPDYTLVPEPNPEVLISCQAVECPAPPMSVTCTDDVSMAEYQDGQQWNKDPCTSCTCHSGHTDCITLECPLLDCTETRPVEGECCPQCLVEELGKCVYEGVTRDTGSSWSISDCVDCHCEDGSISCEFFGCQCPVPPEEQKNCGGYKNGETWFENNCLRCTCTEGEVSCEAIPCSPLECAETVQGETDCCPRCKDDPPTEPLPCQQGDKTYYHGQEWKLNDCITCACSNGYSSCAETECLPLDCAEEPILVEGECCMICQDQREKIPGKPCSQNNRLYKHGSRWEVDKCTECECHNSEVICAVMDCSIPNCPGRVIYDDPTVCCPYCNETGLVEGFCDHRGVEYLEGQVWNPEPCLSCNCTGGSVDCTPIVCGIFCTEYVQVPGECCPVCAEGPDVVPKTCTQDGTVYTEGETFKPDPCTSCSCQNELVQCKDVLCVQVNCSVPLVSVPEECCSICPELFCTDQATGQRIENRQSFKPDVCSECHCADGILLCAADRCAVIADCPSTYIPEGECCEVCADGPDKAKLLPCVDGATTRQSGEQWRPDACQTCNCVNGSIICLSRDCALPCANPIPPSAGQCCGSCPEDPSCIVDGTEYQHGETWTEEPCQVCECVRGVKACSRKQCTLPQCDNPIVKPGECCLSCPEAPEVIVGQQCMHKGNTYNSGEQFQNDACTTCHCNEGTVQCSQVSCAIVTCPDAILREDKCCLECPEAPCITKSGIRPHGSQWEADTCTTCQCVQGVTTCEPQVCPELTCTPEDVPGACCDQCPGDTPCIYKGKTYVKDQRFKSGPCEFCSCQEGGSIFCVPASCPLLTCADPVRREGDCCAVCEEEGFCEYLDQQYPAGKSFQPSACINCDCSTELTVTCAVVSCDIPSCPDPILLEGACCPTCQDLFCTFNGKVYPEGSTFKTDPCSNCICEDGATSCVGVPCPLLSCPHESLVLKPGECCITCAEPQPSCTFLDQTYAEGARWRVNDCLECWCQDTKIWCARIACMPVRDCSAVTKEADQCCPVCAVPPPPPNCPTDTGLTYQHRSRWYSNCGYCTCLNGAVSCVEEFCQPLQCENQVKPAGACCPVCVEDTKACTLAGTTYEHRAVFRINECYDCMCYESAFYCWGSVCRKPACENPVKTPGKCCLECPDPAVGPKAADCMIPEDRVYAHGTFFKTDPCLFCSCNNGTVICNREPCEAKACDAEGEVTLEGECCSRCRSDIKKCVVKGETYSHDDRWRVGDCKECYCDNGVVKCTDLTCPELTCEDATQSEGECCPTCPAAPTAGPPCTFDGMEYTEGQQWRKDKCTLCECTAGTVKCTADQCPPLDCDNPVTVKGECCRACPEVAKSCEIDGKIFKHGEVFRDESCRDCLCYNGAKTCTLNNCPALSCSRANSFLVTGECCPQCQGDSKRACEVNGLKYSDGQQWRRGNCESCRCEQGQVSCTVKECPIATCENPVLPEGECCPKCPDDLKSCSVEGEDKPHGFWGVVRTGDKCQQCECTNGELECVTDFCPPPDCENPVSHEDSCCQSCPDDNTCVYKNYRYVHGEFGHKDECTTCQCYNGTIVCDPEACPVLTCTEVVKVDGECCPRCNDETKVCNYGGVDYNNGESWQADPCSRCQCNDGSVSCDYQNCPGTTCDSPTKAAGECCRRCPGDPPPCDTERGMYSQGETWRQLRCVTCTCLDGEEDCRNEMCPLLTCADPQSVVGECCRKCPSETRSCVVGGVTYAHKEMWQPSPCRNCQCNDGTVVCTDQTCPELTCPEPIQLDDICCPRCPGELVYKTCMDMDQTYSHQQEWRRDACTTCSCNDGIVTCNTENCPVLQCEGGEPVAQEGQCCKVCPEEAQQCEVDGETYEHGRTWRDGDCRVCSCKNAQVSCDTEGCTAPDCDNPITVEGKCCLQCPEVAPARDCEYKNNFYPHSYRWNPDVCTQCNCNDGTVSCKDIQCPEILCPSQEQTILEGECCPVCPDQSKPCTDGVNDYNHGDRWSVDDCTRCTCLNSDVSCNTRLCPTPECDNVIPVEGQCCDSCAGEPAVVRAPCTFKGQEYADGEWWEVDECKTCTCIDGDLACNFVSCPRLTCEGTPIQEEGKCCKTCPADAEPCMDGETPYEHGTTWAKSVCTDCTCNDQSVTCEQEVCPALACEETEDVGQCCKQCKGDPAFKKCTYKDKEYKHGYILRGNNCKQCTCEDGEWACETELCPALSCSDPVSIEGECCKKCPEDVKSCDVGFMYDQVTYKHGEKWSESACVECQCDNGAVVCDHQSCPVPDCSDAAVLEGECCPTCPGIAPLKSCRAGNQKYKNGDVWNPTDCSQCTCSDGDIFCSKDTCPRVTCDNPVKVKGECCKKCPDELKQCQLDGNGDVKDHLETWRVNNCKKCQCNDGKVSCDTQTCPEVDCADAVVPDNQCCPVCPKVAPPALTAKSCEVGGQTYQHGERWDKNACKSCVCDNGKVNCDSPACGALTCTDPIKVPGECCMRCPEDAQVCITADSVEYQHGETWRDGDCKRCKCNNGGIDCDETTCPSLTCSNPITVPGQCCKQCEGRPFETCTYNGEEYQHGERWDGKSHCTSCSCTDGAVDCETPTCPALTCSNPVKVKGQCCRVCVEDFGTCVAADGTRYNHGDEWKASDCVTCTCDDGTTSCNTLKCPALGCKPTIRDEGQCCPRCPADPAPKTCRLKSGVEYISGQSWRKGPCRTCSCDNGNKNCQTESCPLLSCSDPEEVVGECCKRCPEDIPTCLATGGVTYKHGETWQPDACKTCECKEGTIVCTDKLCPKPTCDNPAAVEGECCPQCPGVPSPKSCKRGDEVVPHGDTWQSGPCKSCSCSNGRIDCESNVCPTLTCSETVKVKGECCQRCQEDAKDCLSDISTPYKHGEKFSTDPCNSCECYNGETYCTSKDCNPTDCENPITRSDECCARCPGEPIPAPCMYEGNEVPSGEWWRINPCKTCQCNNGIVGCSTETCPLLTCPNSVKVAGECCRICIDEPDMGCTVDGRRLQTGETFRQSPCSTCTCFFGSLECDMTVCPETLCDNAVKARDECCPRCPDEPAPAPCTFKDKSYVSGESWTKGPCKTCSCENSKVSCENTQCPALDCADPVRVKGECCLKCPDQLKSCTFDDGREFDHGTSLKYSNCTTCYCDNSVITCDTELCKALDCAEPLSQEGKCCDTCPGDRVSKGCTTKSGRKMRHGEIWQRNPCKVCTCDNGNLRCDKETCPALPCDQPLKRVPEECCRKCPPDPDNACSDAEGNTYMPREKWNPDPCTECECTELGGVRCTSKDCPALDCDNPAPVEGQCCMTCDPTAIIKPLQYCTSTRKEGDTWQPTPCSTCTCRSGLIQCQIETCDTLDCTTYKPAGECCPRCTTDYKKCKEGDGTTRNPGEFWRPTNCEECTCDAGMTQCRPITCDTEPTCNDPQSVSGICCPVCPTDNFDGCDISRNRRINHGETLKLDNCNTCTCSDGLLECNEEVCPALDCVKSVKREGECCAECPIPVGEGDCTLDGVVYRNTETFEDPADNCLKCVCNTGEVTCGQPGEPCPPVECAAPIIVDGECCPSCIEGVCEYQNKLYQSGDTWDASDCEHCECSDGMVVCAIEDCAAGPCSTDHITVPGRCCPECPDDFRACMDKAGMYSHGDRWIKADDICVDCFCDDSAICCEHIRCPEPECQNPTVIPGQCCPTCDDVPVPTTCTYKGSTYQNGERIDEQCSSCECSNGAMTCTPTVACPAVFCPNPIQTQGECCPRCGAQCFHSNQEFQDGETWQDPLQTCFTCTCLNGLVRCGLECPALRCLDSSLKDGECCPTCPDISFGGAQAQLYGTVDNYFLDYTIGIINAERPIQGRQLWRVRMWSATRDDGTGRKMAFLKQALNKEQYSQTISTTDTQLHFQRLEYQRDLGNLPCSAFPYVCAEFLMTRDGFDEYTTSTTFGEPISTACLPACG